MKNSAYISSCAQGVGVVLDHCVTMIVFKQDSGLNNIYAMLLHNPKTLSSQSKVLNIMRPCLLHVSLMNMHESNTFLITPARKISYVHVKM